MTSPFRKHDPAFETYERLIEEVADAQGYGGPVFHIAEIDGWLLQISQSDSGDLFLSGTNCVFKLLFAFQYTDDGWKAITIHTTDEDLQRLQELVERVPEWHDKIVRPK